MRREKRPASLCGHGTKRFCRRRVVLLHVWILAGGGYRITINSLCCPAITKKLSDEVKYGSSPCNSEGCHIPHGTSLPSQEWVWRFSGFFFQRITRAAIIFLQNSEGRIQNFRTGIAQCLSGIQVLNKFAASQRVSLFYP